MLLHGYGSSMSDLAALCPYIDPTGYVYICPNAPVPMQVGPGLTGYAWADPPGGSTESLQPALGNLSELIEEVRDRYQVEQDRMVLGGFSQGGVMTYLAGLPRPDLFAGLMALSAWIPGREDVRASLPVDREQPVFVSHGTADTMISIELARQSRDFLAGEGYMPQYNEYEMGHQINEGVVQDMTRWLHEVLPPAGEGSGQSAARRN